MLIWILSLFLGFGLGDTTTHRVAWNSDDSRLLLISNTNDAQINIINIEDQTIQQEAIFKDHRIKSVIGHPIHPDIFALGIVDSSVEQQYIWIYDLSTHAVIHIIQLQSPSNPNHTFEVITDLVWRPDGSILAVTTYSRQYHRDETSLLLWDFSNASEPIYYADNLPNIYEMGNVFGGVAWSPDGSRFALITDHDIQIWDFVTLKPIDSITFEGVSSYAIEWSSDGCSIAGIATIGSDMSKRGVYIWDVETDELFIQPIFAEQITWHPDRQTLILSQPSVLVMNILTKTLTTGLEGDFRAIAFNHAHDHLAVVPVDDPQQLVIYETDTIYSSRFNRIR